MNYQKLFTNRKIFSLLTKKAAVPVTELRITFQDIEFTSSAKNVLKVRKGPYRKVKVPNMRDYFIYVFPELGDVGASEFHFFKGDFILGRRIYEQPANLKRKIISDNVAVKYLNSRDVVLFNNYLCDYMGNAISLEEDHEGNIIVNYVIMDEDDILKTELQQAVREERTYSFTPLKLVEAVAGLLYPLKGFPEKAR
jgi:hypothetical protein